jgi:hypothetical protein
MTRTHNGHRPDRGHPRLRRPHTNAAQCGNSAGGYESWKQQFAGEVCAKGIGASTIQALMATN